MNRIIIAITLLVSITGCDKDHKELPSPHEPTPMELLTSGPWLLKAYGFDDDSTGIIEDYENMISACQQDNTTVYRNDGTGNTFENGLVCGGDSMTSFEWKFIDNNKAIEIWEMRMNIHRLTKNELHFIIPQPYLTSPLHTVYARLP